MASQDSRQYVDKVLIALGAKGRYQTSQIAVLILVAFPAAAQLLSNVFTCRILPYECAPPNNETVFLAEFSDSQNVTVTYGSCDVTVTSNGSVLFQEQCPFGTEYQPAREESAMAQFELTCGRESLAKLSQTLVIIGQGVGAVISTGISDKVGRKPVLVASNLGLMTCGIIIAYAPNLIVFLVFKFLIGSFQQGVVTSHSTYTIEMLPMRDRRLAAVVNGLGWACGTMTISGIAYVFKGYGWRTLQLAFSMLSLPAFFHWWYIDESIRWLLANGKVEQATNCLKRACRMNNKDFNTVMACIQSDDSQGSLQLISEKSSTQAADVIKDTSTEKMNLLDLLRVRRLLINALAIWFAWFTTALGFFTLYLTSTTLSGNRFLNFFLIACMEIPSNIYFYFSLNRFGRKASTIGPFATLSLGLMLSGIVLSLERSPTLDGLHLLGTLVAMAGASGSFGIVFAYTPEMFPTNLRNQALGVSSFMGRIGGMLAPFTGVLASYAKWGPAALISACACVVCLLLLVLPETKNRELPQTLEDLQSWYQKDKKDSKKNGRSG